MCLRTTNKHDSRLGGIVFHGAASKFTRGHPMRDGLTHAAFLTAGASGLIAIWLGHNDYGTALLLFGMAALLAAHLLSRG